MRTKKSLIAAVIISAIGLILPVLCAEQALAQEKSLTFFAWSDQHVKKDGDTKHVEPGIDAMNTLPGTAYPEKIGGKVAQPAFVIGAGDFTGIPTFKAIKAYEKLITERLKYPVYDILGNHDDQGWGHMRKWFKARYGSLTYTFDKGGVHFIALHSQFDPKATTPEGPITKEALDFLSNDLKKLSKGTPAVFITHHSWMSMTNIDAVVSALGDANVILHLGGHYHKAAVKIHKGVNFVQLPSPKSQFPEVTVIRITSDRLVAVPYDYVKKAWVTNARKILDVKIKGPRKGGKKGAAAKNIQKTSMTVRLAAVPSKQQ